ncbi:TetR/AcrR family transcriptional regulator [Caldalkalibacillus mannanilyticus]|uniref:TetR/AcrR family transcriptional regulator n=1 Tax=Caldalkalibacillus mannanilyticus TaxID=1418 RepID=UPI00046AE2F2|nr:TetR/AcrR family transcriptional regulator [Caldalkalibacillus mannanilyticus]
MRILKDPEERKKEILDTAEELFVIKGYSTTTVNDILRGVGIAKGTFYHHFESKKEVLNAIVMRFIQQGVEAAETIAMDTTKKANEKIFDILLSQNRANNSQKTKMVDQLHQVNNAEMHQKSLVETILQLTPVLTKVIEQGIEEGVFNTPYPKETVEFLLVSSQFLFDEGIFQWSQEELIQKVMAFTHLMETSLGANKGTFTYIQDLLHQSYENHFNEG